MSLEQRYIQSKYKSMITDNTPELERKDITLEKAEQRMAQETMEEMNQGFEEGVDFYERMSRSAVASMIGTPGEFERLVKGGSEAYQRTFGMPMLLLGRELSKSAGNEELAESFDEILKDKNKLTALDAALEEFGKGTILPNIKEVKEFMTDKFGFEFEDDFAELVAEIVAPTGVITKFVTGLFKQLKSTTKPKTMQPKESEL